MLKAISKRYKPFQKFVIVFIVNDFEKKYKRYTNLLLIRTSLKSSIKRRNEITLHYIWEATKEEFKVVKSAEKPQIGFCGQNNHFRAKLIRTFQELSKVKCNFVIREKFFFGGVRHMTYCL